MQTCTGITCVTQCASGVHLRSVHAPVLVPSRMGCWANCTSTRLESLHSWGQQHSLEWENAELDSASDADQSTNVILNIQMKHVCSPDVKSVDSAHRFLG